MGLASRLADVCHILAPDHCLIEGQCFATDDWNPNNPCEICRSEASVDAWTRGRQLTTQHATTD